MTLDLVGILDPSPISDGSNALISLGRGDHLGAGLSGLGLIPFIGDLAKVGKLGKWSQTIQRVLTEARRSARFADRVRPILQRFLNILDQLPTSALPDYARAHLQTIKKQLDSILGGSPRAVTFERALLARWTRIIEGLNLSITKNRGVLWSRIGAGRAAQIAAADGRTTLEMLLKKPENASFANLYKTEFGNKQNEATKKIWEMLSRKYASGLSGEIEAYVSIPSLRQSQGKVAGWNAQIWAELDEISDTVKSNPKITSVRIYDLSGGTLELAAHLPREQMLKSTSH
jgi:hypothetical protein